MDKEIEILVVKGQKGNPGTNGTDGEDGKSSYELAIENELFSGTLEEWIETFSTPENYITRTEFQKVTQAQYNAMKQAGTLVENCYYLIIDDTTAQDFEDLQDDVSDLKNDVVDLKADIEDLDTRVTTAENDIDNIETQVTANTTNISTINSKISYAKLYKHDILFGNNSTYTTKCCFTLYNTRSSEITFGMLSAYIPSNRPINVGGYKVEDSGTQHLLYPITHLEYDGISTYYIYYIKSDGYYREALQSSAGYSDTITTIFNLSEV